MSIKEQYEVAKKAYAKWGIDVDAALETLKQVPISIHCWQGDDIEGFETYQRELSGWIAVPVNYPVKAWMHEVLTIVLRIALLLMPRYHRIHLLAICGVIVVLVVFSDALAADHFEYCVQ